MLYNARVLFLHYPKTAGKSASVYLCHNLERPIRGTVSPAQHGEIGLGPEDGVHLETGGGHGTLRRARREMEEAGYPFDALEEIVVVARNPYDLAVSKYHFLRASYESTPSVRDRPNFEIAHRAGNLAEFCRQVRVPDFSLYVAIDGAVPRGLRILHYESLTRDFAALLDRLGLPETKPMPHLNASSHGDYRALIDRETKRIIDERFAPIFDLAGYPRIL